MGFFRNMARKMNGLPTDSEISRALTGLRVQIHSLQEFALALDASNDSDDDISLFASLRFDLLSFSLHIASSDNMLDENEVKAINTFLGMDMSYRECKELIETLGLGSIVFNRTIPESFLLLTGVADAVGSDAKRFANALISVYQGLGAVIGTVDGNFDAREKQDLNNYINMLQRFANTL